jgi:hypothetical protein
MFLNRKTSDGNLIEFRKDNSTVGSITSNGGAIIIGSSDVGVYFDSGSDRIIPVNVSTNSVRNDAIDIGGNPHRFKDLYLSGDITFGDSHFIGNQTTSDNLLIQSSTGENIIYDSANGGHIFYKNGTEKFRIDDNGNVGIGTSGPDTTLDVEGAGDCTISITANSTSHDSKIDFVQGSTIEGGITYDHNGSYASEQMKFRAGNNGTHMVLTGDGKVGIGTTSPSDPLHVYLASGQRVARFEANNSTSSHIAFKASNTSLMPTVGVKDEDLYFSTGDAVERMRIDGSGNLNIGRTSTLNSSFVAIEFNGTTKNGIVLKTTRTESTGSNYFYFVNSSGTNTGEVQQNGTNTVNYSTTSDYRLKENVTADWDATTRLKQLNPVRFNFIADGTDRVVDGFLAHEVQSVVPEAITGTHNEVQVWQDGEELPDGVSVGDNKLDDDGNTIPKYQGIDQSKLVPLLVKTIQELEARIVALENA